MVLGEDWIACVLGVKSGKLLTHFCIGGGYVTRGIGTYTCDYRGLSADGMEMIMTCRNMSVEWFAGAVHDLSKLLVFDNE